MALLALRGKPERRVAQSLRRQVLIHMATDAIGGQAFELPCRSLVARIAIGHRVRADQRKAVGVIAHRFHRHHPTVHRVALLALRAHLAAVNISVAVSTLVSYVAEHGIAVTLHTRDVPVHASQRIACAVVVELGDATDRLPTGKCVAVLAGDVQVAMRTARGGHGGSLLVRLSSADRRQQ